MQKKGFSSSSRQESIKLTTANGYKEIKKIRQEKENGLQKSRMYHNKIINDNKEQENEHKKH
jgi:hypothetical protein